MKDFIEPVGVIGVVGRINDNEYFDLGAQSAFVCADKGEFAIRLNGFVIDYRAVFM
jgi:hypothetical protein